MENMGKNWLVGQGAAAVDTLLYCSEPVTLGGFAHIREENTTSGGSGSNLMVTAAQLGVPSTFVARIGDDELGRRFRRELREDGVDDRWLISTPEGVTLHTYIAVEPDGSRTIFVHPGDCYYRLSAADIPKDILDNAAVVYTDGSPRGGARELVRLAKEKGLPVFYQRENTEEWLGDEERRLGEEMLSAADIISGGPEIYRELVGTDDPDQALRALYERFRPQNGVIMTAGHRGAYWFDGMELLHQPVFSVRAVDTTGAGDCFCGALITAWYYRHKPRAEALSFAAACAAMKCTMPGPRFHGTEQQVLEFIRQHI